MKRYLAVEIEGPNATPEDIAYLEAERKNRNTTSGDFTDVPLQPIMKKEYKGFARDPNLKPESAFDDFLPNEKIKSMGQWEREEKDREMAKKNAQPKAKFTRFSKKVLRFLARRRY